MRVLARQAEVLAQLRTRASIVLTATGLVASLFAPRALEHPHPLTVAILAIAALALGLLCCVAVIWSAHDAGEVVDPDRWREAPRWPSADRPRRWYVTFPLDEVMAFLEGTNTSSWDDTREGYSLVRKVNHATIDQRTTFFEAACLLLVGQIGLWAALLLTH